MALSVTPVAAAEWRLASGVDARTVYSDNATLSADEQESDLFSSVAPRLSLTGTGRHLRLRLDYQPQYVFSLADSESSRLDQQVNLIGDADFFDRRLSFDGRVQYGQRQRSNRSAGGLDAFDRTDNRTNSLNVAFNARWQSRLSRFANFTALAGVTQVSYDVADASDTTGLRFEAGLDSGNYFNRLRWDTRFRFREFTRSSGSADSYADGSAGLRFRLNRRWSASLRAGLENNQYDTNRGDAASINWSAGLNWTPSKRTSAQFTLGKRFFGTTYAATVSHQSRRTRLTFSYNEEISQRQLVELELLEFQSLDDVLAAELGQTLILTLPDGTVLAGVPRLGDENFVRRRFSLDAGLSLRRSALGLQLHYETREYERSGSSEDVLSASARWSYTVEQNLGLRTVATARWLSDSTSSGSERFASLLAALDYRLGSRTRLTLEAQHRRNDSDVSDSGYAENRVSLGVGVSF